MHVTVEDRSVERPMLLATTVSGTIAAAAPAASSPLPGCTLSHSEATEGALRLGAKSHMEGSNIGTVRTATTHCQSKSPLRIGVSAWSIRVPYPKGLNC